LATTGLEEVKVRESVAGKEVRSEPCNQTSVRIKSGAMVKVAYLTKNIPQPGAENQMKSTPMQSLYHKEPLPCDLSDALSAIQQSNTIADEFCVSNFADINPLFDRLVRPFLPLSAGLLGLIPPRLRDQDNQHEDPSKQAGQRQNER
jgi:hypothetical protein